MSETETEFAARVLHARDTLDAMQHARNGTRPMAMNLPLSETGRTENAVIPLPPTMPVDQRRIGRFVMERHDYRTIPLTINLMDARPCDLGPAGACDLAQKKP